MPWGLKFAFMLFVTCAASSAGCRKPRGSCEGGPRFATLALPAAFQVSSWEKHVGTLAIPTHGVPSFEAAGSGAEAERAFLTELTRVVREDALSVGYETYRDGVRSYCGVRVKKGSPEYADALRQHFVGLGYRLAAP